MSRLDDELRFALRREEPSSDFADRVLELVAARKTRKPTMWQKLLAFFQPQPIGWIAATATAALLIAAAVWPYPQVDKKSVDQRDELANQEPAPEIIPDQKQEPEIPDDRREEVMPEPRRPQMQRRIAQRRVPSVTRPERVEKTEGEIAKERLMLALQIASAKLNEAQRIVQNED